MARTCVFCGKNKMTREHVFAKWIRETYYEPDQAAPVWGFQKDGKPEWSYSGDKSLGHTVKGFCARCNNGWMSELETKAGKILQPMLRAKRLGIKLGYAEQVTVASWATKTALVLHQFHPTVQLIPESDYRDFYRKIQPSSNVFVLLGARHITSDSSGGEGNNIFDYNEGGRDFGAARIVQCHYAIGALYLAVIAFVGRPRKYPRTINEAFNRALQVWPVQPREVVWPSLSISDIGGVNGMFDAFTGTYWG